MLKLYSNIFVYQLLLILPLSVFTQFEDDQIDLDEAYLSFDNNHRLSDFKEYKSGVIFPGTKWCGNGDAAEDYDQLGKYNNTDICCRAHDHCPLFVEAKQSVHGLINTDSSTRSSCDCDEEFYKCLKKTGEISSKIIGTIYFDILKKVCLSHHNETFTWKRSKRFSFVKFIALIRNADSIKYIIKNSKRR